MTARVSVVTPFYNTERFLEECIQSVLAQTFQDFEYILWNNRSTDGSLAIAERYAARDPRIRVLTNETFMPQVENYNAALGAIADGSEFVKVVQADDWLYPRCLEEMVALADGDASVGIVASYRINGLQVTGQGLPVSARVIRGRDVCRQQLLEGHFFFGSPTTVLYRASIVRSRRPFYPVAALHDDTEACYEILREWNFGFVHQVLSFIRRDDDSITGAAKSYEPEVLDKLIAVRKFGKDFLAPAEFASCWRRQESQYLRRMAVARLKGREPAFWAYQRRGLATIGDELTTLRLLPHMAAVLLELVLNPQRTLTRVLKRL